MLIHLPTLIFKRGVLVERPGHCPLGTPNQHTSLGVLYERRVLTLSSGGRAGTEVTQIRDLLRANGQQVSWVRASDRPDRCFLKCVRAASFSLDFSLDFHDKTLHISTRPFPFQNKFMTYKHKSVTYS